MFMSSADRMLWFVLLTLILLLFSRYGKRNARALLVLMLLSLIVLVALPGRGQESRHYLLPLAPSMFLLSEAIAKAWPGRYGFPMFASLAFFLRPMIFDIRHQEIRTFHQEPAVSYLREHAREGQSMQVFGNRSFVYLRSGVAPASRIFYTWPLLHAPGPLLDEMSLLMRTSPPHWLYVDRYAPPHDSLNAWLRGYTKVQEDTAAELFEWVVSSPQP